MAFACPSGDDARTATDGLIDPVIDAFGVGLTDHGAHLDAFFNRISRNQSLDPRGKGIDKVTIDFLAGEHTLRADAYLTGVGESR